MNRKERNYQVISKIKSFHCNNAVCSSHLQSKSVVDRNPGVCLEELKLVTTRSRTTKNIHLERRTQTNQPESIQRELQIQNIIHSSKTRWMFFKTRSRQNYLYSLSTNGSQARSGEQEQWVKSRMRRPALVEEWNSVS